MKYTRYWLLIAAAAGNLCALPAAGVVVAAMDASARVRSADTVVVGHVIDSGDVAAPDVMTRRATWMVDRVLKSETGWRSGDRVMVRLQGLVWSSTSPGSTSLLVLTCRGTRDCEATDPDRPAWPALPPGAYPGGTGSAASSTLMSAVARELAAVVAAPDDAISRSLGANQVDSEQAMMRREEALEALRTLPRDEARTALARSPAMTSSTAARLAHLTAEIQLQEAPDIAPATADLLRNDPSLASARHGLAGSLVGTPVREARWVPTLSRWLSAPDVEVRRAAAYVLAEMPSDDAATALLSRGIVDDDREVRFYSVAGLVKRKGDGHSPSVELFQADEARWLAPWLARRASNAERR